MRRLVGSLCSVPVIVGLALTMAPTLHTSEAGLTHIATQEGCVRCRYSDSVGYATIGVGHRTASKGAQSLSDPEIASLYAKDIKKAETCVFDRLDGHYMPQSVFDASVSLVLNVGCQGALVNPKTGKPTAYSRAALANDWPNTCYYLGDFIYADGLPVLRNRRKADQQLCIQEVPNVGAATSQN